MSVLQGDLADYPLPDLLQFFHNTRKHGQLLFEQPSTGLTAGVFFEHGEIVHAFLPPREGEDAFYRLFNWSEGRFAFLKAAKPASKTISSNVQNLLLEGLRRLDEGAEDDHLLSILPPMTSTLHLERDVEKVGDVRLTQSEWKLMSLVNGRRKLKEILDLSELTSGESAQMIYNLMVAKVITETFDDTFLVQVVLTRISSAEAPKNRATPPSILANLILREIDGLKDLQRIKQMLNCSYNELCDEIRLLVRTHWVKVVQGQDVYRRFF